jgi:hypothetical protein
LAEKENIGIVKYKFRFEIGCEHCSGRELVVVKSDKKRSSAEIADFVVVDFGAVIYEAFCTEKDRDRGRKFKVFFE